VTGGRRWATVGVIIVVVAGGAVLAAVAGRPAHSRAAAAGGAYPTSLATVTRQSLTSQTLVDATLGAAGSWTVVNQASGTITALPAIGQVVPQGQALYQVSGSPVVLLYGNVPAWRNLWEGLVGPDVAELNGDLVALGYASHPELGPHSDVFSPETAAALERLQARLGTPVTGGLALGQAVFLPAAAQITALGTTTVLGGPATAGAALLTATSTTPIVTIDLDPGQQTDVKDGDQVTIALPSGQVTPGIVASVGTVAAVPASADSGGSGDGSAPAPVITVEVALSDPPAARGLSQAPVEVAITTGSVSRALVVPVNSLLAQPGGGYAVEVAGPHGHHLTAVIPGLFDDAAGLVEVTGTKLEAGQHVVVPAP
jgi:Putative peptidoglycan binding domain